MSGLLRESSGEQRGYNTDDKAGGTKHKGQRLAQPPDSPVTHSLQAGSTALDCVLEKDGEVHFRSLCSI